MGIKPNHKLLFVTITFWFLFLYIIAALTWWFIALNQQNKDAAAMRLAEIKKDDTAYIVKVNEIENLQNRKAAQYLGEGISFMAVIMIGAFFIYRTTRRRIKFAQQQQNFMMAITHELKTPIAIAQLNLETLQKRKLNEMQQAEMLDNSMFELDRLNNLCNNILWAAQLEDGSLSNTNEQINLSNIIINCVGNIEKRFASQKIIVQVQENILMKGDELMMQVLTNNLVENALKYSPKNKQVVVELVQNNSNNILYIKDEGEGIAESERKKVFEKFYRTGNETTRKTKGTGLGLYLCKRICDKHNATINISNNKPCGSIFKVVFNK